MLPTIAEDRLLAAIYWLGAFCTLGILTILYAENRLYRLLEHFFIGLAVGYGLFIAIRDVLEPVWWRAMMTESSGVIANFDKSPNLKGVVLDRTIKREGDGAWRWSPRESPRLLLTKVPTDWGTQLLAPLVALGQVGAQWDADLSHPLAQPRHAKGSLIDDATADQLCRVARIFVGLTPRFSHHG